MQKVKNSNTENSVKIKELKELFGDLDEKIKFVFKEQNTTTGNSLTEKKKEGVEMRKTK